MNLNVGGFSLVLSKVKVLPHSSKVSMNIEVGGSEQFADMMREFIDAVHDTSVTEKRELCRAGTHYHRGLVAVREYVLKGPAITMPSITYNELKFILECQLPSKQRLSEVRRRMLENGILVTGENKSIFIDKDKLESELVKYE